MCYFDRIDTLRKDYAKPIQDTLVNEFGFMNYENAITPSSWTLPAHASIFTGLYPALHGAHETRRVKIKKLSKSSNLITKKSSEKGFHNYLFTANYFITPFFGFKYFDSIFEA